MKYRDERDELTDHYKETFARLDDLHQRVQRLHPALEKSYPIALADTKQLMIYDFNTVAAEYRYIKDVPLPMPIPKGIRSAFQLEEFGGRIACVVTPDVFDALEGYVTILHEFVHCYQYETCEQDLKQELDIARKAQEVGDCMWEIEHPFPYESSNFTRGYLSFLSSIKTNDHNALQIARRKLRSYLGVHDFEYMVWQEWKEGFARWIENRVKLYLGLPENKTGFSQPFSRVIFYGGGEIFISYLVNKDSELLGDLPGLFHRMFRIDL